jgi:UPF0716 protein FxsA
MPLFVLVLIFIVVPIVELYLILQVGEAIGAPLTILILVVDSIVGSLLLKSQGRAVWGRFNETMAAGKLPHREVLDGVMVIFGGAFLITPGFITDVLGLLLLLPPTRYVIRRFLVRMLGGRVAIGVAGAAGAASRRRSGRAFDVEGTATEVDQDSLEPRRPRLPR